MKLPAMVFRLLLLAVPACGRLLVARKADEANPVSQVVSLLQDLEKKAEEESDKEKALFEKFKCKGKSSIQEKEEATRAAEARVSMLQARDAELDAQKTTLAQEKEKMEKEISTLKAELNATAEKNAAAEAASLAKINETERGVEGIRTALETLNGGEPSAGLLLKRAGVAAGSAATRAKQAADLQEAVDIGEEYLSKADAVFLRTLLTGKASTAAVKLAAASKDKTASHAAEARKKDVTETLAGLEKKFEKTAEEDKKQLKSEHQMHVELEDSKKDQLEAAEESLAKNKLTAAKGLQEQQQAKEEIEELQEQVAADKKYMEATEKALEEKEKEFNERFKVSLDEVSAIGEAIAILRSDEARDTFSKSYSFMQLSTDSNVNVQCSKVRSLLSEAAATSHNARLMELLKSLRADSKGSFDTVVAKIEAMQQVLETEAATDLKRRDACKESERKDSAEKQSIGFEIKDTEADEESIEQAITDITRTIETKTKEIGAIVEELETAEKLRDDEHKAYLAAKQNDGAALQLLKQATLKLSEVYKKGGALLQRRKKRGDDDDDFGYKASSSEPSAQATGVIGTLEMVADNLKKGMDLADKEEETAKQLFAESQKELSAQKQQLETMKVTLEGNKGEKAKELAETQQSLSEQQNKLSALSEKMKDAEKTCDFIVDKFDERTKNRDAEIQGLTQAKTVLKSAKVD